MMIREHPENRRDSPKAPSSVRIQKDLQKCIKIYAAKHDLTIGKVVESAIHDFITNKDPSISKELDK